MRTGSADIIVQQKTTRGIIMQPKNQLILKADGTVSCVCNGKRLFDGTLEEMAMLHKGTVIDGFIKTLKDVAKKAEGVRRWRT
jgi:hypothetical protein